MNSIQRQLKNFRNYCYLRIYCRLRARGNIYEQLKIHAHDKVVIATIAFQQPWVIEWLLQMWKLTIHDATLLIADNSKDNTLCEQIKEICVKYGAPYISLPKNPTRHANRSHAMAMQWVYENIFLEIQPDIFGFIDHDLIPFRTHSIIEKLRRQPIYGYFRGGFTDKNGYHAWNLWAGYCFFNFHDVRNINLNFLYDFSLNLDTGGMNYHSLYKHLNPKKLHLASSIAKPCSINGYEQYKVQIVDNDWYHIGSISYNDNLSKKADLVKEIKGKILTFQEFY